MCVISNKKHSPILVSVFVWSGLRDSLGSLLRSPTRTRPTNSPPDCSLLRNGLFESRLLQFKNKKSPPCGEDFHFWSGLRDSNSLPSPWQGDALPDELNPQIGASGRNRTIDTRIFSPLLYRLSYRAINGGSNETRTRDLLRDRLAF